jgi:hypothetical protein
MPIPAADAKARENVDMLIEQAKIPDFDHLARMVTAETAS